eukprot:825123-Lingulodinium_polyedra.AAC.1
MADKTTLPIAATTMAKRATYRRTRRAPQQLQETGLTGPTSNTAKSPCPAVGPRSGRRRMATEGRCSLAGERGRP